MASAVSAARDPNSTTGPVETMCVCGVGSSLALNWYRSGIWYEVIFCCSTKQMADHVGHVF